MIKGVNRQVVEVKETGCEYFERIMFFVKPEYISVSEGKIRESAGRIAGTATPPPQSRRCESRIFSVLKLLLSALTGGAAALIIMNILK